MAFISSAKLSDVEKHHRLDADFYKPQYLELESMMKGIKHYKLSFFAEEVKCGPFGSTVLCETYIPNGIPLIRPFNLQNMRIDGEIVYIAKEDIEQKRLKTYKNEDIFFSRVGDIKYGIVYGFDDEVTISPNIIALKVNKQRINPYYLITFLTTNFGFMQIERGLKIVAQPTIETNAVRNILIPLLDEKTQSNIEKIIKNAFSFNDTSKSLYFQAEYLLLEELGLKDFKPKYKLSYIVDFSKAFGVHRVDAEYFQPGYDELTKRLKANIELEPFRQFLFAFQKGIEVGSENYQEGGKPFIRVSNISVNGFVERDQKYISEELYHQLKEPYEPLIGDFLLTKDATPGIAYVVKEPVEGIISSGILKLNVNESKINKEYLALCINTIIGKMQIERDGGGSVITHWRPEQIKSLLIPMLSKPIQEEIASLIQQSHEARKKTKELLEEAKRKVEEAIESEIRK